DSIDGRHDHARIRDPGRVPTVAADDATDASPNALGELHRLDEVRTDVALQVAAADGQHKDHVAGVEATALEPVDEDAFPALVIGPRRQLGDVVGGTVRLDLGDFAEVVDGVGGVGGAASDAQEEQTPAALAQGDDLIDQLLDGLLIETGQDLHRLRDELGRVL